MDNFNQYGGVPEQDFTGQILYQGNIHNTNLTDLFFLIIHERKIGILEVWEGDYRKRIHFRSNGVSVTNISPPRSSMLLGNQLIEIGRISQEQLDAALNEQQSNPRLLGEIFVEQGLTTLDEVMALIRRQIKQDIFEIFFWPNLEYAFYEGESLYETPHIDMRLAGMTFDSNKYVVDLANVLGYMITLEHPGTLFIRSAQRQTDLHFNGSMVEFSNYGQEKQIRLGELLIEKGWLTEDALSQGLADQKASEEGGFLGEILIFRGYLTEEQLIEALKEQMAREFMYSFGESQVSYTYLAGGPPSDTTGRSSTVTIPIDLRRLVMESYIVVDDWEQFISLIPNSVGVFPYDDMGNIDIQRLKLDEVTAQLNEQINRNFNVQEIAQMLALPYFETSVLLAHFIRNVLLQTSEAFQKVLQAAKAANNRNLTISALNQARVYMPWELGYLEDLVEQYKLAGNKKEAAAYLYELAFLKSDEKNFAQNIDAVLKIDPHHFEARKYMFDYYTGQKTSGAGDERAIPHAEQLFDYHVQQKQYKEAQAIAYLCEERQLDPLRFAQKTVDMYSQINNNEALAEELKRLAEFQKNLKRFESEYQTLARLREISNDRMEIDARIKILRKMGIGPPEKNPMFLYAGVGAVALILVLVLYFMITSGGEPDKKETVQGRIQILGEAQVFFDKDSAEKAIDHLRDLCKCEPSNPEVEQANAKIAEYESKEKIRSRIWNEYNQLKKDERWSEAYNKLMDLIEIHTPEDRKKQQQQLTEEKDSIAPRIQQARDEFQAWFSNLEALKQQINNCYNKRTQDPLNLIKADEYIKEVLNLKIPKIIDSSDNRKLLEQSQEFALKMRENILRRRLEIVEKKRFLLEKCQQFRKELESFSKSNDREGFLKRSAGYYQENVNGFIESFSKPINDNNVETAEEPVAELYQLNLLLIDLTDFVNLLKNPPQESLFGLLNPSEFMNRIETLQKKVQADFGKLNEKYASNLAEMKELAKPK